MTFLCPLCADLTSNPGDHLKFFHNFTDQVARDNFLDSRFFVFQEISTESNSGAKNEPMSVRSQLNAPHHRFESLTNTFHL